MVYLIEMVIATGLELMGIRLMYIIIYNLILELRNFHLELHKNNNLQMFLNIGCLCINSFRGVGLKDSYT